MSPELKDIVQFRLHRAQDSLAASEALIASGAFLDATSRIYYACFYAVSALLLTKGKKSTKHSGVRDLFNLEFVRTGDVSVAHAKFYRSIFDSRIQGDYQDFVAFEPSEVEEWFDGAKEFGAEIPRLTRDRLETL